MPQAVQAVALWVASYFGGSALVAYAVEAAIYYAVGRYFYSQDQPTIDRGRRPLNSRLQYLREPNAPQRIIYGEATLAPAVVADFSNKKNYHMLLALCPHDIEEIVSVRVNGDDFLTPEETGLLLQGLLTDSNLVRILAPLQDGDSNDISELRTRINDAVVESGTGMFTLIYEREARKAGRLGRTSGGFRDFDANDGASWSPSAHDYVPIQFGNDGNGQTPEELGMKMSGLSWAVLTLPRAPQANNPDSDNPPVWQSVPTLTFRVKRANSTLKLPEGFDRTPYSRGNAALCAYDYLARYTDYATPLCGIERIDDSNLEAAAQFCEARGLTCNGVIELDRAPADVMEQIGFALNGGVFTESAGIRKIVPGAPSTPVRVITDDDIVENSWAYSPMPEANARPSDFICRYADTDGLERTATAHYHDASVRSSQEITLDLVNNRAQAESVARIMLSRIWNGASLSFSLLDPTLPIRPYDLIRVRGGGPLNLDATFRVLSLERTPKGLLNVQCVFEDEDLFVEHALDGTYIPAARPPNYSTGVENETFRVLLNDDGDRLVVRPAGASEDHFIDYR